MKLYNTVKGIAVGTSLAAFVTLGVPTISHASQLLASEQLSNAHANVKPMGDKADPKKDTKKDKKKKKGGGEGSCGEGSCGEGSCGGKKDEGKKK